MYRVSKGFLGIQYENLSLSTGRQASYFTFWVCCSSSSMYCKHIVRFNLVDLNKSNCVDFNRNQSPSHQPAARLASGRPIANLLPAASPHLVYRIGGSASTFSFEEKERNLVKYRLLNVSIMSPLYTKFISRLLNVSTMSPYKLIKFISRPSMCCKLFMKHSKIVLL